MTDHGGTAEADGGPPATDSPLGDLRLEATQSEVTGAAIDLPSTGPCTVSVTVVAEDAVAGLRFAVKRGTDRGIQLVLRTEEGVVELSDESGEPPRTIPAPEGPVRLSARVHGERIEAAADGRPVGTARAPQPAELTASLVFTGSGWAEFSDIRREPVESGLGR